MGNIALQIERNIPGAAAPGGNVIFETIAHSIGNISYNDVTGDITFLETGRYIASWSVVTQASSYPSGIIFELVSDNNGSVAGNLNAKTGEVTGYGIIEITSVPTVFSLKNSSPGTYYYSSQLPRKASLVITKDEINTSCLGTIQMINILSQMIASYSSTTWTIYTGSLYTFSGMPQDLYTAPGASMPGFLRLIDVNGDFEAIPIRQITVVYPGDGTVYDPALTYLAPPSPMPRDCFSDYLAAVQSYLPVGISVGALNLGPSTVASGEVYRNEYGVLVLSDSAGNTPIFISSQNIQRVFITGGSSSRASNEDKKPQIKIAGK